MDAVLAFSDKVKKPVSVEALLATMREELGEPPSPESAVGFDREQGRSKRSGRSPRHVAMDVLAYRDHSRLELEEKLTKKLSARIEAGEVQPEDIADLLDSLVADGLLNEPRFAESFINGRVRKGQGPVRIRRDLGQKGLAQPVLEQAFAAIVVDWLALATTVRHKKFGEGKPADYKARARQVRFLQYRGFSGEQIRSAFDDLGESFDD